MNMFRDWLCRLLGNFHPSCSPRFTGLFGKAAVGFAVGAPTAALLLAPTAAGAKDSDSQLSCASGMAPIVEGWTNALAIPLKNQTVEQALKVDSFCMDKYEVTAGEYTKCVTAGKCTRVNKEHHVESKEKGAKKKATDDKYCTLGVKGKEDHPINCVTKDDARAYCSWVGKTLPTRVQWIRAAGGRDMAQFPWRDRSSVRGPANLCGSECPIDLPKKHEAWTLFNSPDGFATTAPVSQTQADVANGGDVYGLGGNVSEWVLSEGASKEAGRLTDSGTTREKFAGIVVAVGGSWKSFQLKFAETGYYSIPDQSEAFATVGFRCVSSPVSKGSKLS